MSIDTELQQGLDDVEPVTIGEGPTLGRSPHDVVEVRRRPAVSAALGAGASVVAIGYLARAAGGGEALDWALAAVLAVIGIANLAVLLDARTPLLVADDLGVRLRLGRTWVGLPWEGLDEVEHQQRRVWWRDGLLTLRTRYVQRVLEDLDPGARRVARLNRRLHRSALAVPLGLGTRVVGAGPDLTTALAELAGERTRVVEIAPAEAGTLVPDEAEEVAVTGEQRWEATEDFEDHEDVEERVEGRERGRRLPHVPDPRPAVAHLIGLVAARFDRPGDAEGADLDEGITESLGADDVADAGPDHGEVDAQVVASQTPPPVRETVAAARADLRHESRAEPDDALEEDTQLWGELHALADDDAELAPLLIDDYAARPADDPVIGPAFARARERLGLSVDELADRTRIRPHVIEAVEVDDFSACGGDFYARGHLRTLARVLGLEAAPVLATYDERYADAPIDPRRVFEAELAGAGSIRATRGGPNWSVLVAAVMALILCWSVARLVTARPGQGPDEAVLSGSGGPNHTHAALAKPVPVKLTAAGGGAHVVVRDGLGKLVFAGNLSYGQTRTVRVSPPVGVRSSDGSVQVTVGGQDHGRMGPAGRPASKLYVGGR